MYNSFLVLMLKYTRWEERGGMKSLIGLSLAQDKMRREDKVALNGCSDYHRVGWGAFSANNPSIPYSLQPVMITRQVGR